MKTDELTTNFVKKKKKILILYIIFCILYYPLQTATFSIFTGKLFSKFSNLKKNKDEIIKYLLIIFGLYLFVQIAIISKEKIETYLIPEFNQNLRTMIFDNLIDKMRIKYKDLDIGEVISRLSMITLKWDELLYNIANIILPFSLTLIFILGYLTYQNSIYGLITILYLFGTFILLYPRYKKCLNDLIDLRFELNDRHNDIQDKINNLFDIYLANTENQEKRYNLNKENKYTRNYTNVMNCNLKNSAIISMFNYLYFILITGLIIYNLLNNKHNSETVIGIFLLITWVISLVDHIFKAGINSSFSFSVLKESEKFLNEISEFDVSNSGMKVNAYSNIKFTNVYFKYKQDMILKNINLNINKNNKIIIKGQSGSGKSTLVKLLCGFYEPTKGKIMIDGVDITKVNIENLRSQISMLNQTVKLFNESVYDNIRYTDKSITKSQIDNFIKKHKILLYHDVNLNKSVGQNGSGLSGGQKQMTLVIRCILTNKNVLIFDEPTSALDNYHFGVFNDIISKTNKTIIVITHDSRFDKSKFTNKYHMKDGILKKVF